VLTRSSNYTLGSNVEQGTLLEEAGFSFLFGNGLDNILTGNSDTNYLRGEGGNDQMIGGAGDDTYYVESAGDIVVELDGGGNDAVVSSIDYTLGAFLEGLVLSSAGTGTGNASNNYLRGSSSDDTLYGMGGDDTMTGEAGADVLYGGEGNDMFTFDANDEIIGGAGMDRIDVFTPAGFDFTGLGSQISGVEVIYSRGIYDSQNIRLSAADVYAMSDTHALYIVGETHFFSTLGDRLHASGGWTQVFDQDIDYPGFVFDSYQSGNGALLHVVSGMQVFLS